MADRGVDRFRVRRRALELAAALPVLPMKAASSAATSWRGRSPSPTTPAFHPASTPFRRSPVVGLTEAKAKQFGRKIKVRVNDMSDWLSSRTYNEPAAWAKVIVDETTDRILGAHIVGHAGEELIHVFAFAMKFGITASQINDAVFAFSTFSADIKHML
jgi:hypothetical protein